MSRAAELTRIYLYGSIEFPEVGVRRDPRTGEYWVILVDADGTSHGWGPFAHDQVLRALRLSRSSMPDGCERAPWTYATVALHAFSPVDPDPWAIVPDDELPPSLTRYPAGARTAPFDNGCEHTGPPAPPLIDLSRHLGSDVLPVELAVPPGETIGILAREWNAHPAGSVVVAPAKDPDAAFVIVDTP